VNALDIETSAIEWFHERSIALVEDTVTYRGLHRRKYVCMRGEFSKDVVNEFMALVPGDARIKSKVMVQIDRFETLLVLWK
jgi:hypothetical protein